MTIATQQHFPAVLFIMPNKVVLMFKSVDKLKQVSMIISIKAITRYVHDIFLCPCMAKEHLQKYLLTFESYCDLKGQVSTVRFSLLVA